MRLQDPTILYAIVPIALLIIWILRKQFIKFKDKKAEELYQEKQQSGKFLRAYITVSRILIIAAILVAIAGPFTIKQTTTDGDTSVTILADNSTSFELFDGSIVKTLQEELGTELPTSIRYIAVDDNSAIGDGILQQIRGNDNVLLVTDGQVNAGKNLGEVILYSSSINSTINAVELTQVREDLSVEVFGPDKTVSEVDNSFLIRVRNPNGLEYKLDVTIDGVSVLSTTSTEETHIVNKVFFQGQHTLTARVTVNDHFQENNVFYKTIEVVQKPKVLFVTQESSPMQQILDELYETTVMSDIPANLNPYHVVILNNRFEVPNDQVDKLSDFVIDGNGLVVVGGPNAFDRGNYEDTLFETLLPVNIGLADQVEGDINIVMLVDISGSTGNTEGGGASTADIIKAQALEILQDLRGKDNVGVIAFNTEPFEIMPLTPLAENRNEIIDRVSRLRSGGGTLIDVGVQAATQMLSNAQGASNIIIISDGRTKRVSLTNDVVADAAARGIRVYTVGIGEGQHENNLQNIARLGQGIFFQPNQGQRLRVLFGQAPENAAGPASLYLVEKVDSSHFITGDVPLDAAISGFNQVAPKSSAQLLLTTNEGVPVLTTWRFGLGRVVAWSTDDGSRYAGELLSSRNSQILSRSFNWAIGDLNRRNQEYISVKDTFINEPTTVLVRANDEPSDSGLNFVKVDSALYQAEYVPQETGFHTILGKKIAINYNTELQTTGFNQELEELVETSGGRMVNPSDIDGLVELIKKQSQRLKTENVYYRWPLIILALVLLLIEFSIRRVVDNKNKYK